MNKYLLKCNFCKSIFKIYYRRILFFVLLLFSLILLRKISFLSRVSADPAYCKDPTTCMCYESYSSPTYEDVCFDYVGENSCHGLKSVGVSPPYQTWRWTCDGYCGTGENPPATPPSVDPCACDGHMCSGDPGSPCDEGTIGCGGEPGGYPCYEKGYACVPASCDECLGTGLIHGSLGVPYCDNECRIHAEGWACDTRDPKDLTVWLKNGEAGYIAWDFADNLAPDAAAIKAQCNTNSDGNHRFHLISDPVVPSVNIKVGVDAYANIDERSKPLLNGVEFDCEYLVKCNGCTPPPVCTTNPGTLSDWGDCSNGKQTRTCDGATCCPTGCTVGTPGCDCGNCNGEPLERPCLYVEGNIWSDDNGNLARESSENWWNPNYPVSCSTSKSHPSFYLTYTGHTGINQINEWYCNGNNSYYRSPFNGLVENIEPEQPHTFTLSNWPDGYKPKSWVYENYLNYSETSGNWISGNFTTTSLSMPASGWTNVHWELEQEKYNLEIIVKKIKPEIIDLPDQCTDGGIYDGSLENASITVYDADDVSQVVCSGSSNSEGKLTCPIWILQGPLKIEATKTVGGATPETYELRCPNSTVYEYDPGSVNDGDNKSVGIGLKVNYKDGWVSAIDSDIFANLLSVVVPEGPTDNSDTNQTPQGFAKTLINSSVNDEKHLGFIFSEVNDRSNPNVDTECPNSKGFETTDVQCTNLGGFSYNLISGGEHDSKWLESFTFKAPENSLDYIPKSTSFKSGEIYNIGIGSGEGDILPTSYSITDGDSVAILYIDGNLTINNNFTTNSSGRLLLVVNGSVTISKDVGTDVGSFLLSQDPNIEAGIVASGGIYFNSIGGLVEEGNNDKPIMVSAPLISKESLTFARDLYHDNNAIMPAESAKSFNKYLYLLTSLERQKSQDNLYFTGVTTFDLDWEYIY